MTLVKAMAKVRGSREKSSMTVLHRIASLIITLLTIDSATTTGIAIDYINFRVFWFLDLCAFDYPETPFWLPF